MIEIRNLNIKLGSFRLKNISFEVKEGEYFVILGPSGAGKTVILELLAGLIKPDKGKISGINSKKSALIYQDYMLFPHLNVFKNIAFGLNIKKEKKDTIKKIVTETAAKLDISHLLNRDILNLSGGESQRVAIARASAVDPLVYLLDEPTAALDINTRKGILELFKNIHKENKNTFIHVTHNFEEALFLADRIAVIKDGEMIQIGEPNEIFNHPKSKFVADFVGFENVFHGKIKDNIFTSVHDEFFKLYLPSENTDNIYLAVKSEDIIVSKEKFESSARNQFKGIVDEVIHKLANIEIKFKVNNSKLICAVTKFSFEEMQIEPGKQFWLTFKSSSIKAFPH